MHGPARLPLRRSVPALARAPPRADPLPAGRRRGRVVRLRLRGRGALGRPSGADRARAGSRRAPAPVPAAVAAPPARAAWLFDPTPALDPARLAWQQEPSRAAAGFAGPRAEPPVQVAALPPRPAEAPSLAPEARLVLQPVPLPVPRPSEFRAARPPETPRLAERQTPRRGRAQSPAAAMADTRTFFEKLFGAPQEPARTALAYAGVDRDTIDPTPRRLLSPMPSPPLGEATAIYDITAGTVTLPSGERLEAHSGLGDKMDDPRFVHVPMRGATPPGTYDLTERERLFHGVRAIRLNPVGGPAAIHGRVGLLAHTYMLGPTGASNGCVSFRNYDRFLQAFLRGEVRRMVVVAGRG
ncbi:DUF2778 domain-containing protein [Methylobacterium sp. CB376]|uniref:tlde1 domain-containing protein n=1 Tax=Methylobacterium sp. CB376 TaxID=3138063 RepID=UPI0024B24919|nr:tlde1 domain-containing protein [Methylobacterium nodulans]WFT83589.1 DUF2778 domain-containing protein [Methylobacterium nodulans]